jgi:hypothetical protein
MVSEILSDNIYYSKAQQLDSLHNTKHTITSAKGVLKFLLVKNMVTVLVLAKIYRTVLLISKVI